MMENEFNPVIRAVQSLRKLSVDIRLCNQEIQDSNEEATKKMAKIGRLIVTCNDSIVINLWENEKEILVENTSVLLDILQILEDKLKNKDYSNLSKIWQIHDHYKEIVVDSLEELQKIGNVVLMTDDFQQWKYIWRDISSNISHILSISEIYKLKLVLMENLEPEEIDALTLDILKYIPWNYPDDEAYKHEREYLEAYNELKGSQSKKRNLWDKVLNILASGIIEKPAHRLRMRRWMKENAA